MKKFVLLSLAFSLSSTYAIASEEGCYAFYMNIAAGNKNQAQSAAIESMALPMLGIFGVSTTTPPPLAAAVTVIGGTTGGFAAGEAGTRASTRAYFAENIAQSIAEAHAMVTGPYTIRLTNDLNDAIYDSGRFATGNSPLSNVTKTQLREFLNEQKLSTEQLSSATKLLDKNNILCPKGEGINQDTWASLVVSYAVIPQ